MKVKCIENKACQNLLTVGKEYEVIGQDNEFYEILGDDRVVCKYYMTRFEIVEEEVAEKSQFNWEEFINTKTVVNCDTEDKAKNFLEECRSRGIVWPENKTGVITETCWDYYKEDTCYSYEYSRYLYYSPMQFYESNDYKIIKWECENMKFKVGDWVTVINGSNIKNKVVECETDKQGNKGYILDCDPFIYFGHELKLYEEPQIEFVFQEVVARIKEGEVYISHGGTKFDYEVYLTKNNNLAINFIKDCEVVNLYTGGILVEPCDKFKLQVPKKQVSIYEVEHKQEGKKYYFRSSVALNNGDFVVCDTTQGKSYGRVVGGKVLELTENETNRYKECWRA